MTLEQLRHFKAVAETGSFTRAAERLFVSHSTISRSVQALEREFNTQLLIRNVRSVSCTQAGTILLEEARELLYRVDRVADQLAGWGIKQELRVISVGLYAPKLFDQFRCFQQEHPELIVHMEQGSQLEILEKLRNKEADLTITFSYSWPAGTEWEALVLENGCFCALVSPHHLLAQQPFLNADELENSQMVLGENPFRYPKNHSSPPLVDRLERDMTSMLLQVKTGKGMAILPEHAAAEYGQSCVQVPIQGKGTDYQLLLGWRKDNKNPLVVQAVDYFQSLGCGK